MKIVREHINEKFSEDSDPIRDIGVGNPVLIRKWLDSYEIKDYRINADYTIDIYAPRSFRNAGRVEIHDPNLTEFPDYIQFNVVTGYFAIDRCNLTTLRGCPRIVTDNFWCAHNRLTSLDYCPKEVGGSFICHHNRKFFTKEYILSKCKTDKRSIQPGKERQVRESFSEDSDPVRDMGIGIEKKIREWAKDNIVNRMTNRRVEYVYSINDDFTIDVEGDLDISFSDVETLPDYIHLNSVTGNFSCCLNMESIETQGPKKVFGDYTLITDNEVSEYEIREHCDVDGDIIITSLT